VMDKSIISITDKGRRFVEAANRLIAGKYEPGFDALRNEFILFAD
jgi:hypothetical protein